MSYDCAGFDVDTSDMAFAIQQVGNKLAKMEGVTFAGLYDEIFGAKGVLSTSEFAHIRLGCSTLKSRLTKHLGAHHHDPKSKANDTKLMFEARCRFIEKECRAGPSTIVNYLLPFVRHTSKVLVLGSGSCLALAIKSCISVAHGVHFYVLEGKPGDEARVLMERTESLKEEAVRHVTPEQLRSACTIVPDSAVAALLTDVDFIVVGAYGVTDQGSLIHCPGTQQLAMLAHAFKVPFYVLCESFKFCRIFPLSAAELNPIPRPVGHFGMASSPTGQSAGASVAASPPSSTAGYPPQAREGTGVFPSPWSSTWPHKVANTVDLVPPQFIALILSEVGIITPSTVAHELIRLESEKEAF